jgi:cholesterol transport system auxiliary component
MRLHTHSLKLAAAIFLLMASVYFSGCTLVQPIKPATMAVYALDVQFEPVVAAGSGERTLLVNTPSVLPGLNTSRMIYLKKPHEINYFSRNKWIDSPARMLAPLLVQAIEHTGKFRAVVLPRMATNADIRLDTEIIHFEHEFMTLPSQIHLTIRAQLVDNRTKNVLRTREFDLTEAAPGDTPYDGVNATNRAVKTILQQVADFCALESTINKLSDETTEPAKQ